MRRSGRYEDPDTEVIIRSRLSWLDLVVESLGGLLARPSRMLLTALGTVLGIAALVATLGLAKTAGSQIVSRFDPLAASQVVVEPNDRSSVGPEAQASTIPWDAEARLVRLNGVVAAGTRSGVDVQGQPARSVPVVDPLGRTEFQIPVIAASPGLLGAVRGELASGRWFDQGHSDRGDPVAVLGAGAAERLNVTRVDQQPAIFVGEQPLIVIGILEDVLRQGDLLGSIIVPDGLARARFGLEAPASVHIDTEPGAAQLIGEQAPIALDPNNPDRLQSLVPPEPRAVRAKVEEDVQALFLVLGGVSLLVGALGIANVTLVSVLERVGEIGLRRAVGATRHHVAAQFVLESTFVGLLGGVVGTSLGILVTVTVSAVRDWTPVLDPWLPFAAPAIGAVIGLVAGTYPAWRASAVEPIAALRGHQ